MFRFRTSSSGGTRSCYSSHETKSRPAGDGPFGFAQGRLATAPVPTQTTPHELLSQDQGQAILVVADYYDFGVGALSQIFGGFDAFPLQ